MKRKRNVEELIADSMKMILDRAQKSTNRDRLAITHEFREWRNGS
mgnify:CR=1 FL=1|tara:strand:+ start:2603 stop:2737 length:135 start_codon:yes stop_codon:yes gene_type:complete